MCNHKRWICILLCVICLSGWAFAQENLSTEDKFRLVAEYLDSHRAELAQQEKAEAEAEAEAKRIAEENFAIEYEANLEAERTRAERNTIIQNCVLLGVGTAVCVVAVVAVIKNNRRESK